mmetsp:Transcript_60331/g.186773  ORF Transcript_60331/g.186773 Transcript_60331/m.186773 type:complete len:314 (-) Transcript_60331:32-973(-)
MHGHRLHAAQLLGPRHALGALPQLAAGRRRERGPHAADGPGDEAVPALAFAALHRRVLRRQAAAGPAHSSGAGASARHAPAGGCAGGTSSDRRPGQWQALEAGGGQSGGPGAAGPGGRSWAQSSRGSGGGGGGDPGAEAGGRAASRPSTDPCFSSSGRGAGRPRARAASCGSGGRTNGRGGRAGARQPESGTHFWVQAHDDHPRQGGGEGAEARGGGGADAREELAGGRVRQLRLPVRLQRRQRAVRRPPRDGRRRRQGAAEEAEARGLQGKRQLRQGDDRPRSPGGRGSGARDRAAEPRLAGGHQAEGYPHG